MIIKKNDRALYIDFPYWKSNEAPFLYERKIDKLEKSSDNWRNIFSSMERFTFLFKSLYIGGDVSILNSKELSKVKLLVDNLDNDCEFTVEIYQNNFDFDKVKLLISLGVNRINYRTILDKKNNLNFSEIESHLNIIYGLLPSKNINIDLLFTSETNIDEFTSIMKYIKHISLFPVILNKNENLSKKNELLNEKIIKSNFIQYELTNYSKKNFYSVQNLFYYNSYEWYGIGNEATSFYFRNDKYFYGTKNNLKALDHKDVFSQVLMMSLSLRSGLNLNYHLHKITFIFYKEKINFLIEKNKLTIKGNNILVVDFPKDIIDISRYILN